jgi:hypothetical protein
MLSGKHKGVAVAKRWTHTACFEFFDTKPKNPRWSWSGRSDDGKAVSVTLWKDRFLDQGRTYKNFDSDVPGEWRSRPGFVELIENLKYASDHLDGAVRVIIATPKDPAAQPRSIAECYPQEKLRMRVSALDDDAGTFTLERI